ncbi:site-specific integrase [Arthrobacter sp. FW305-BF8]|uniref:site-specific integrase n=1 Tax=Arthrobacter sp. FW305-BF8 TaxID=2879617 RepID=UPI001F28CAB8|nr:site-specific integrase [Arthrobacter sp. FW305-BF8]UKA55143.1 site-specific integrase [Arthrobacter sp. FW305-BF8]
MSRNPLPLGTWGVIHTAKATDKSWRARAKYRDLDGKTRKVEAWGPSAAAARRNLQIKLQSRQTPRSALVTSSTKISSLADVFLAELESSDKASRTKDKYAHTVTKYISPQIGSVRVGETTSGVVDHFIRNVVEAVGPATARTCAAVLSWMFKIALRHDAVSINPVLGLSIPKSRAAKPQALDPEQFTDMRTKLLAWEREPALGRSRTQELHEIADFLVNTGLRAGELFALMWTDIDLDADPPTAHVHATVIRTSTGGVTIQDHPKSEHGIRYVTIPPNLVTALRDRRARQDSSDTSNPLDLVFPSSTGTVCDPNNVGKTWRKAADAIGYSWVTLKTFRKANATLIARTMGAETAAYQAGHSKVSMTRKHYVEEYKEAIDTRAVLSAFDAANPGFKALAREKPAPKSDFD